MDLMTLQNSIIRKKLEEIFGVSMTTVIMNLASAQSSRGKTDSEKLSLLCDFICSNAKIVAVLGAAEAKKQSDEWKKLASKLG